MREFKFRMWEKDDKMIYFSDMMIDFLKDDKGAMQPTIIFKKDNFDGSCSLGGYCDIEQYTGRKDYNDNEIYEGDIIESIDYHGKRKGIVIYSNGTYFLQGYDGYSDEYLFNQSDIVVIGNIHEHKELFKQLQD